MHAVRLHPRYSMHCRSGAVTCALSTLSTWDQLVTLRIELKKYLSKLAMEAPNQSFDLRRRTLEITIVGHTRL